MTKIQLNFNLNAINIAYTDPSWIDVSDGLLDSGFQRKRCYGKDGKMEQQTLSFRLKPVVNGVNIATQILSCPNDIRAHVFTVDGLGVQTQVFVGTIRPLTSARAKSVLETLSLQIIDDSYLLDYKLASAAEEETTYPHPSMQLLAASPTRNNSLIYWLLCHVKVPVSVDASGRWTYAYLYNGNTISSNVVIDSSVGNIGATLCQGLELRIGDNVKEKLDSVMYEMGLQYRYRGDGKILISRASYDSATDYETGAISITDNEMKKTLSAKRSDSKGIGAIVKYNEISTKTTVLEIFRSQQSAGEINAGSYVYLKSADNSEIFEFRASDVKSSDGSQVSIPYVNTISSTFNGYARVIDIPVKNRYIGVTTELVSTSAEQNRGIYKYKLKLSNLSSEYFYYEGYITTTCVCSYVDVGETQYVRSDFARSPETYECKYVHTEALAESICKMMTFRTRAGSVSYSFDLLKSSSINPGDIIHLQSGTMGIDTYARVTSVTDYGESVTHNTISVEAEGIEALEDLPDTSMESVVNYEEREGVSYLELAADVSELNENDLTDVSVRAAGRLVDNYGGTLAWSLNGAALAATTKTVSIPTASLQDGVNVVSGTVTTSTTTLSRSVSILYHKDNIIDRTVYYLATSQASGVTTSTPGWTTTTQSVSSTDKYLWQYEIITRSLSGSTTTAPYIAGAYGDQGQPGQPGPPGPAGPSGSGLTIYPTDPKWIHDARTGIRSAITFTAVAQGIDLSQATYAWTFTDSLGNITTGSGSTFPMTGALEGAEGTMVLTVTVGSNSYTSNTVSIGTELIPASPVYYGILETDLSAQVEIPAGTTNADGDDVRTIAGGPQYVDNDYYVLRTRVTKCKAYDNTRPPYGTTVYYYYNGYLYSDFQHTQPVTMTAGDYYYAQTAILGPVLRYLAYEESSFVPQYYSGSAWVAVSSSAPMRLQSLICSTTVEDVLAAADAVDTITAYTAYFQTVVASDILANYIFANAITVGNYIKGGDRYADDGTIRDWSKKGFWLGADGTARMSLQSDNNGNTYVGTDAGKATQVGTTLGATGNYNTALGYETLRHNVTGDYNVSIGYQALYSISDAVYNVALGAYALYSCTHGGSNVAIGVSALYDLTTGTGNIGIGPSSNDVTTGSYNLAIGNSTNLYNPTGWDQINLDNILIYLPFNSGRKTKAVATALTSYIGSGAYTACLAVYGSDAITKMYSNGVQVILYGASGSALLTISTTDADASVLSGDLKILFLNPVSRLNDALTGM